MNLLQRTIACSGCGTVHQLPVGFNIGRLKRCANCPPAEPPPPLDRQLEDLIEFRLGLERRFRSAFRAIEHAALLFGAEWPLPARHVCAVPAPRDDDPWTRKWRCEACGQAWVKPNWYAAYQPVSEETYRAVV